MLQVGHGTVAGGTAITRRHLLQVGGIGAVGLTLADWWRAKEVAASPSASARHPANSCIFLFLSGGPSHLETFDPKPNAPVNIRGPYGTIPTNVPGIRISELLPQVAEHMDKCAILRSMTSVDTHSGSAMLTGTSKSAASYGAVLAKLQGSARSGMPAFVHTGPGGYLPGAGSLGTAYNPILMTDPSGKQVQLPQFALTADISADRFQQRRALLGAVDKMRAAAHANLAVEQMDTCYQQAINLLTSDKVRTAFDLAKEPDELRNRYGGSIFGQSCILARRLVEAGTRFRPGQLVQRTGLARLGRPWSRPAGPGSYGIPALSPARSGLVGLAGRLAAARPAVLDPGDCRRRIWPHAAGQSLWRPRPLAGVLLGFVCRRRRSGGSRRRGQRQQGRLPV